MNQNRNNHLTLAKPMKALLVIALLMVGSLASCSKKDHPAEQLPKKEDPIQNGGTSATPKTTPKDTIPSTPTPPQDTVPKMPEPPQPTPDEEVEKPQYQLAELEGMTYEFEVVFHVLSSPNTSFDNRFTSERADSLLSRVNNLYAGKSGGVDARVRFVLATKQPDGSPMQEKGLVRGSISAEKLSYFSVVNDVKGGEYYQQSWDIKRYINVYIFMFSQENVNGVSTYPDMREDYPLPGLKPYYSDAHESQHTCIAINGSILGNWTHSPRQGAITTASQATTLAHEFGHYLGLYHVFVGPNNPEDYCDDTKEYNRASYESSLAAIHKEIAKLSVEGTESALEAVTRLADKLYLRKPIDGSPEYVSVNIMDYRKTYGNQFTRDQVKRMRHCLYYSPTLPGPKVAQPKGSVLRSARISQGYAPRIVACP